VGALERELEGVKGDVARSARGVELLCEFVASANAAPSGEGERSLQERLHEFTQQPAARPALAPPPDQTLPWARPQGTGNPNPIPNPSPTADPDPNPNPNPNPDPDPDTGYMTSVLSGRVSPK